MDPNQGRIFGDFEIGEVLGRGGMGVVYRATRIPDGRTVALKLMLPEISANAEFRDRFVREARIAPALDHPNIVSVYETGAVGTELYIVMELIDGLDLKALIAREGRLPPRRVLAILEQAADALDTAHISGVVHGDVKPQNIMITQGPGGRDRALLTDFGLIRPVASESTASRTGAVFGSIQYMAPENIEGLPADGRADVYSLGCVAFEALTGRIPFDRPNEIGVIWAHVHEQPPRVTDQNASLPGGLNDVLRQAMAKHPDDRFLTCGELVEALNHGVRKSASALVPTAVRPLVHRRKTGQTEREVWAPNFFPELSRVRKLTDKPNWARTFATAAALILATTIFVEMAHTGGVVGAASDAASTVSDLANRGEEIIGSVLSDEPEDAPLKGDTPRRRGTGPAAGAGIGRLAGPRGPLPRSSGGASRSALRTAAGSRTTAPNPAPADPALDIQKIVYVRTFTGGSSTSVRAWDVVIADADGSNAERLEHKGGMEHDPVLSPTGEQIAYVHSTPCEGDGCMTLHLMQADGTRQHEIADIAQDARVYDRGPDWAPDGKSIVFARWIDDENSDLWITTKTRSGWRERRLTRTNGEEYGPKFSPDGTQIVYAIWPDDDNVYDHEVPSNDVWLLNLRHPDTPRRITYWPGNEFGADWSPDGKMISFGTGARLQGGGLYVFKIGSNYRTRIADAVAHFTSWSEDGKYIAYQDCPGPPTGEGCRVMGIRMRANGNASRPFVIADAPGEFDGFPAWGPAPG